MKWIVIMQIFLAIGKMVGDFGVKFSKISNFTRSISNFPKCLNPTLDFHTIEIKF